MSMLCVLFSCSSSSSRPPFPVVRSSALSKHGHRLLSSIRVSEPTSADSLIRKFVASSSKSVSLNALSHLLSNDLPSLALPMYRRICKTPWFKFNPKLTADVVALLGKHGLVLESQALISESILNMGHQDLALFYLNLVESYSEHRLKQQVFDSYECLKQVLPQSSSLGRRSYVSMINGLCLLDLPCDAEEMLEKMGNAGHRPSAFEFRLVVLGYGRSGLFSDMRRILHKMEDCGFALDTVCANMVLSCYGVHGELSEMDSWLGRMKDLEIAFSIRTYNSVLNSCPTIMSMLEEPKSLPLSIEELFTKLTTDEVLLVRELVSSGVLVEILEWSSSEGKLDMHGLHLVSAFLILLQWVEELRTRLCAEAVVPLEISVVCGSGKHSSIRGESPIKLLVSEMMFRMNSPLKIDRKNVGRFVARGKAVKDWLC
ncbi:pentatricopeptide repeat-containing protein At2g17033 isoform X1 [Magnolia sinica]|uniref:pentatricopeptide repeat-containing protein At2g17033 isoform X1 n=1 Tax=Magnolia sinica TaxID=86752 RepID=UPI002659E6C1|nr:pentatricopeptide repeat-containing protein At2g17033 isoform X1 [Magnolia sinica]XP_058098404.1 pentatricopeptide repeat-containing protein At2g17033 isoform X1 [Magnolia sinica]